MKSTRSLVGLSTRERSFRRDVARSSREELFEAGHPLAVPRVPDRKRVRRSPLDPALLRPRRGHDQDGPEAQIPTVIVGRAAQADRGAAVVPDVAPRAAATRPETAVALVFERVAAPFPDV